MRACCMIKNITKNFENKPIFQTPRKGLKYIFRHWILKIGYSNICLKIIKIGNILKIKKYEKLKWTISIGTFSNISLAIVSITDVKTNTEPS